MKQANFYIRALRTTFAVLLACGLQTGLATAETATNSGEEAGTIVLAAGTTRMAGKVVKEGDRVPVGVELSTGADGYLYLKTVDNGFLILRPDSTAVVETYQIDTQHPEASRFKFSLRKGVARSISGEAVGKARKNFRFNTPVAAIGVRGTDFSVYTNAQETRVAVHSGRIVVSSFDAYCLPQGSGPCEQGMELLAGSKVLQILKGKNGVETPKEDVPSPDVTAPPREDEPKASVGHGASATLSPQPGLTGPDPDKVNADPINWGRYERIVRTGTDIPSSSAIGGGEYDTPWNSKGGYAIYRLKSEEIRTPLNGRASFILSGFGASVFQNGVEVAEARPNGDGYLRLNFDTARFTTRLDVTAQGQDYSLTSDGSINSAGIFLGTNPRNQPNRMYVHGFLKGKEGKVNGGEYVFEAPLENGTAVIKGATHWGPK